MAVQVDLLSLCYLPAQGSAGSHRSRRCFQLSPTAEEDLDSGNPWSLTTDGVQKKGKPSGSPARCQEVSLRGLTPAEAQKPSRQTSRQVINGARYHQRKKLPIPVTAISREPESPAENTHRKGRRRWDQGGGLWICL